MESIGGCARNPSRRKEQQGLVRGWVLHRQDPWLASANEVEVFGVNRLCETLQTFFGKLTEVRLPDRELFRIQLVLFLLCSHGRQTFRRTGSVVIAVILRLHRLRWHSDLGLRLRLHRKHLGHKHLRNRYVRRQRIMMIMRSASLFVTGHDVK